MTLQHLARRRPVDIRIAIVIEWLQLRLAVEHVAHVIAFPAARGGAAETKI